MRSRDHEALHHPSACCGLFYLQPQRNYSVCRSELRSLSVPVANPHWHPQSTQYFLPTDLPPRFSVGCSRLKAPSIRNEESPAAAGGSPRRYAAPTTLGFFFSFLLPACLSGCLTILLFPLKPTGCLIWAPASHLHWLWDSS